MTIHPASEAEREMLRMFMRVFWAVLESKGGEVRVPPSVYDEVPIAPQIDVQHDPDTNEFVYIAIAPGDESYRG